MLLKRSLKRKDFPLPEKRNFYDICLGGEILKRCSFSFQKLHMAQLKSQVFLEKYIFPWGKESNTSAMGFLPQLKRSCFFLKTSICHRDFISVMLTPLRPQ